MGNKVDISEVEHFSGEVNEYSSSLQTQLTATMDSINELNSMKTFSGKAADAAKQYFTDVHLTLLEAFGNLFGDLEENVEQHKKAFGSQVDASDNAVIESNYLNEVNEEIVEVYGNLEDVDENIYDTIQSVADIATARSPNFSDVVEWINHSTKKIQEVDEDLQAFTSTGAETDVDEMMQQIEAVMESAAANKGQSRFTNFIGASNIKELLKLKAYNALSGPNSDAIVARLSDKMKNGETLTAEEREILYMHLQEKLTSDDVEKINEITNHLINNPEKMKEYVNENVLATESSLENEIILLEEYLFTGNMKPSQLNEDTDERIALRSYLDMLKNYHVAIHEVKNEFDWEGGKEEPLLARVEYIELEFDGDTQFSGNRTLKSQISIDYNQGMENWDSRKEFLDFKPMVENAVPLAYNNISEVEYYYGQNAVTNRMNVEEDQLKDDMKTLYGEYLGSELLGLGIGTARDAVSIPAGFALSFLESQYEQSEMSDELQWLNIKKPANTFSLEMKVNDRHSLEQSNVRVAELYPTDKTYDMIERWNAIHQFEEHFPYDGEAINNHDWERMYELFHEAPDSDEMIKLKEHDQQLFNYMRDGTVPEEENRNKTIEKIEDMLNNN